MALMAKIIEKIAYPSSHAPLPYNLLLIIVGLYGPVPYFHLEGYNGGCLSK